MRRSAAVVLTLALVASALALASSSASAEPYPPGSTPIGVLESRPSSFKAGQQIELFANFPSDQASEVVEFFAETSPNDFTSLGTDDAANQYGNAYFEPVTVKNEGQDFFARTPNGVTQRLTLKPTPEVTLSIQRDCPTNDCLATATASGAIDPAQAGRVFELEYLSGSTWKRIDGASGITGATGKVEIVFNVSNFGQWSAKSFRIRSAASGSDPAATSNTIKFMPGPEQLGRNVLRVDVEDGIFPTKKGPEYSGEATLSTDGNVFLDHVELENFGVRGTSTAGYTKKPYKLKFEDSPKDTGVFGMEADKSWTLLASFLDQTFVRDKVGLDLGRRINEDGRWTPNSRFVELFVNDQYRGSYLMTESVKIDGDRVNVHKETGMIMEVDNALSSAFDFISTIGEIVFAFKDPDERKTGDEAAEGFTSSKMDAVKNRINNFEKNLYSSSTRDEYERFINEEAAIDFMFIKEFTKDNDSDFNSSHYFSWDSAPVVDPTKPLRDGKFHFGPAWDFDRSAGNVDPDTAGHTYVSSPEGWMLRGTGTPSDGGRQLYRTHWFVQLFKDSGFNTAVKARWAVVRDEFKKVGDTEVAALKDEIGIGARNDRDRWADEPKRYRSHGSFHAEIAFVTEWYKDRYNWMNGRLN